MDQYTVSEPATLSAEGYRLVWYHSSRKAEQDAHSRRQQVQRAMDELAELRQKLSSPRTRYRQEAKVAEAVREILEARGAGHWIVTKIKETTKETFHQDRRGRPNDQTRYVKKTSTRFELAYHTDNARLAAETCGDGVFPLIINDDSLPELEMLLAYKSQPSLEKRFSHLKRACKSFCVNADGNRFCLDQFLPRAGSRFSKMIAKWFGASLHLGIGSVHFLDAS